MKGLFRANLKFIFFILFFITSLIQSQQLALPIQIFATVQTHQISDNDFVTQSRVQNIEKFFISTN